MAIIITMPKLSFKFPVSLFMKNYEKLNDHSGIYIFYDKEGVVLYVGQTKNFYTRLKSHLAGRDNSRWFSADIHEIHIYYVAGEYEREIYETFAIREFQPAYNTSKVFGRTKSSHELEKAERINTLRDERRDLVAENIRLQERFDDLLAYGEDDLEYEDLHDWGVILQNRRRISEIDREISTLRKVSFK